MDDRRLIARWARLFAAPTEGWDFSEFDEKVADSEPPWSYDDLARAALGSAESLVDLGTGGGEFLLSLAGHLPADTHATEGWAPNLPVAREVLAHLGIEVSAYDAEAGDAMPYPDGRFDLILDRHESWSPAEVVRTLRPGGRVITQQVDGRNMEDLRAVFNDSSHHPEVTLAHFRAEAEAAGLVVERAAEWFGPIRFADVDTLVSFLRWMPWELPDDFTVERYAGPLLELHRAGQPPVFTEGRFLLVCNTPVG
ncbi:MAG: class I SAM-dependent methyltransferase [Nocardioides sp.]|nr:class I SAM-dependent methyltransferase [Nocardioides sp.]